MVRLKGKLSTGRVGSCMVLLLGLAPETASSDVVHLQNGRTMEGVVLEETATRVLVRLPFGEVGLPMSSVRRIERNRSALAEYLERKRVLETTPGTASRWLELAVWAESEGLDHSSRESTMVAARLDPGLPELIPLMTAMGYEYEENLAVWIPFDDLMRRRGFVLRQGRWLSPAQAAALQRSQQAAQARELDSQRQDRLARAMEMMVLARMVEAEESRQWREGAQTQSYGLPLWGGYPVVIPPNYRPGFPVRPQPHRPRRGRSANENQRDPGGFHRYPEIHRPPGGRPLATHAQSHRGGFQEPPDSQ